MDVVNKKARKVVADGLDMRQYSGYVISQNFKALDMIEDLVLDMGLLEPLLSPTEKNIYRKLKDIVGV